MTLIESTWRDAVRYTGRPNQSIDWDPIKHLSSFRHPGYRLTLRWRLAKSLVGRVPLLPQLLRQSLIRDYSCDISLTAQIYPGVRLPHPIGIVIGDNVVIEEGVTLMQNTTLGGNRRQVTAGRETPILRAGSIIGPHSVVVGPVEVPRNMVVKAGSVVTTKNIVDLIDGR